jgi:hypothetical protein
MPVQDAASQTIVSVGDVRKALTLQFGNPAMSFTELALQAAVQSATSKIEQWTNRRWVPYEAWTQTYDAPPSSRLTLDEEVQAAELTVTAYGAQLTPGDDGYRLIENRDGTAIETIERLVGGVAVRWDNSQTYYRGKIVVAGTAYYGLVPPAVYRIALMLSVWEYLRNAEAFAQMGGPPDAGFNVSAGNDADIQRLLKPWTRFAKRQIQRVGTD